jgi:hypothetical protein
MTTTSIKQHERVVARCRWGDVQIIKIVKSNSCIVLVRMLPEDSFELVAIYDVSEFV